MSENYLYGTAPCPTNPSRVILVKILNALGGGGGGGGIGGTGQTYTAAGGTNPTGILTGREGGYAINLTDGGIYYFYNGQWNP